MAGWTLSIDLGTSFVCAATSAAGKVEILEIENTRYLPSAVWLDPDGHLVTGQASVSQGAVFPERLERLPKRALVTADRVLLGETPVPTIDLAAALLRRVADEAVRRIGSGSPATVVLTHPARWGQPELDRLSAAAEKAGLASPLMLPEPVAAAAYYATQQDIAVGQHIAVFDLGGGTLDTAVLRRTATGFLVAGMPGGDAHFGGEDVDELLLDLVAAHAAELDQAAWDVLWAGEGRAARRERELVRRDAVIAKQSLSSTPTHTLYLRGFDDGLRITRRELEEGVEEKLAASVDQLLHTLATARVEPAQLAALFLTGGATRMPRVSEILAERTGILPRTTGDPKAVTVLGALHTVDPPVTAVPVQPKAPVQEGARAPEPVLAGAGLGSAAGTGAPSGSTPAGGAWNITRRRPAAPGTPAGRPADVIRRWAQVASSVANQRWSLPILAVVSLIVASAVGLLEFSGRYGNDGTDRLPQSAPLAYTGCILLVMLAVAAALNWARPVVLGLGVGLSVTTSAAVLNLIDTAPVINEFSYEYDYYNGESHYDFDIYRDGSGISYVSSLDLAWLPVFFLLGVCALSYRTYRSSREADRGPVSRYATPALFLPPLAATVFMLLQRKDDYGDVGFWPWLTIAVLTFFAGSVAVTFGRRLRAGTEPWFALTSIVIAVMSLGLVITELASDIADFGVGVTERPSPDVLLALVALNVVSLFFAEARDNAFGLCARLALTVPLLFRPLATLPSLDPQMVTSSPAETVLLLVIVLSVVLGAVKRSAPLAGPWSRAT